jgi:hypothetical protein
MSLLVKLFCLMAILALLGGGLSGCGLALDWTEFQDGTCFDCRTVCEGPTGDDLDSCLSSCSECQGFSACFELLDGRYPEQVNSMEEWDLVDCDEVY